MERPSLVRGVGAWGAADQNAAHPMPVRWHRLASPGRQAGRCRWRLECCPTPLAHNILWMSTLGRQPGEYSHRVCWAGASLQLAGEVKGGYPLAAGHQVREYTTMRDTGHVTTQPGGQPTHRVRHQLSGRLPQRRRAAVLAPGLGVLCWYHQHIAESQQDEHRQARHQQRGGAQNLHTNGTVCPVISSGVASASTGWVAGAWLFPATSPHHCCRHASSSPRRWCR